MTISARIVRDSLAPNGARITTFVLRYPRWLHPEVMTHRSFSRNASSSRAIPIAKLSSDVLEDVSYPIIFRANRKGMQGGEPLPHWRQFACKAVWWTGSRLSVALAKILARLGAAKETANRLQETYGHISVVLTGTEFANFFALRWHPDAQPEICELARQMHHLYKTNTPGIISNNSWHLPFVSDEEIDSAKDRDGIECWPMLIKLSVARCARVSFLNHEGRKPSQEEDLKLYDRLLANQPIHASPAEHQATPLYAKDGGSGNFKGWLQYRKMIPHENITVFTGPLKDF